MGSRRDHPGEARVRCRSVFLRQASSAAGCHMKSDRESKVVVRVKLGLVNEFLQVSISDLQLGRIGAEAREGEQGQAASLRSLKVSHCRTEAAGTVLVARHAFDGLLCVVPNEEAITWIFWAGNRKMGMTRPRRRWSRRWLSQGHCIVPQ